VQFTDEEKAPFPQGCAALNKRKRDKLRRKGAFLLARIHTIRKMCNLKIAVDGACESRIMKGENTALYKPCTSKIAYERGRQNGCNEHKRLR
jgi:hypothetical protein